MAGDRGLTDARVQRLIAIVTSATRDEAEARRWLADRTVAAAKKAGAQGAYPILVKEALQLWAEAGGVRRVLNVAYRLGARHEEQKDLAQDALLHVNAQIHKYDPSEGAFNAWVNTVARREMLQQRRAIRTRAERESAAARETRTVPPTPEDVVLAREVAAFVEMTDAEFAAPFFRVVGGEKRKDVARSIGMSYPRFLRRFNKMISALRGFVEGQQLDEE